MANASILAAFERFWLHVVAALGEKADANHSHDDKYYTETEIDTKLSGKADASHTHTVSQISDLTATATELNYMDGVTSNVQTQLNTKVDAVSGKGLSTNDFTNEDKEKLNSIPEVTEDNEGDFLRVVNGVWAVSSIANAEEASF